MAQLRAAGQRNHSLRGGKRLNGKPSRAVAHNRIVPGVRPAAVPNQELSACAFHQ